MADLHSFEDQAALYVLDGLNCVEREEFKTRLAESAELRALVQELEEGTVALAMAAPRRQPPGGVWKHIERGLSEHPQQSGVLPRSWFAWRRSGWAAAAACLVGWVSYAVWMNRPHTAVLPLVAPNEAY